MKADTAKLLRYAWRGLLVAVLAAGILLLGYSYGRARLVGRQLPSTGPERVQAVAFAPLDGSRLVRSYECLFNGEKTVFAQYTSPRPARDVIEQFEARYSVPPAKTPPTEGTTIRMAGPEYAAASAIDSEGCNLGIVAFEDPKTGGSSYFVGRSSAQPRKGWRDGDVAGDEIPGIPRPLRSKRVFCIDGLGGIPSRLLIYEGWGAIDDTVALFAAEMPKAGWTRNTDAENVIQKRLSGRFLSFLNGTKRAMIYIERDEGTNKTRTAVAYTVKSWLPPDRGL